MTLSQTNAACTALCTRTVVARSIWDHGFGWPGKVRDECPSHGNAWCTTLRRSRCRGYLPQRNAPRSAVAFSPTAATLLLGAHWCTRSYSVIAFSPTAVSLGSHRCTSRRSLISVSSTAILFGAHRWCTSPRSAVAFAATAFCGDHWHTRPRPVV